MDSEALDIFLKKVRKTRLVEYLDPVDETAEEAFNRRLRWARVNQHDPRNKLQARFLIQNEADLREVLRREHDPNFLPLEVAEKDALAKLNPCARPSIGMDMRNLECVECSSPLRGRVAYFNSDGWLCRDCALGYD